MRISILVAVKNEEKYVREAIASILCQEKVEFEVIVVDDNSSDDTLNILKLLCASDPRLKVIKSNGYGKNAAFNLAFENCTGDAICLFAGDDIMPTGSLKERRSIFDQKNGETIILSKMMTISEKKSMNGIVIPKGKGKASTSGASPLIPKGVCKTIFPIPESLPNEDTWIDLHFTYFYKLKLIHTDVICCHWRIHEGNSISHNQSFEVYSDAYARRAMAIKLFAQINILNLPESLVQNICARIMLEAYRKQRNWLLIVFTPISMADKLRAIVNSSKFLFLIRKNLYRLTSGW